MYTNRLIDVNSDEQSELTLICPNTALKLLDGVFRAKYAVFILGDEDRVLPEENDWRAIAMVFIDAFVTHVQPETNIVCLFSAANDNGEPVFAIDLANAPGFCEILNNPSEED